MARIEISGDKPDHLCGCDQADGHENGHRTAQRSRGSNGRYETSQEVATDFLPVSTRAYHFIESPARRRRLRRRFQLPQQR
jgi:hypothetical protein